MPCRALILRAPGTNCDLETAHAFKLAGAETERVHIRAILAGEVELSPFQVLCIPGGFSYGDDVAAGRILANQLRFGLGETLANFRDEGKLILGICNGFQVLIKSGLLLADDDRGPRATLTWNDSGRFEDRWVNLHVAAENHSPFFHGIEQLELPIAHAEGKFIPRDEATLQALIDSRQVVIRYARKDQQAGTPEYPENPNGSIDQIAGICDPTGRVLGLMPHPERFVDPTQHPQWTRRPKQEIGGGLRIFQNAVRYFD